MKCPKCGFNSFETHDACKKCGNDLSSYKDIHGLKPIVLPVETRAAMAEKLMAEMVPEEKHEKTEAHGDMFSFDVPEPAPPTGSDFSTDDPFNFDDIPAAPATAAPFGAGQGEKSAQQKAEEDAFADLLESTSQAETPAPKAAAPPSDPDDLSNFSWDDTPEVADDKPAKSGDDFDDLFGDSDATKK